MFCPSQCLSGGIWCQFVQLSVCNFNYLVKVVSARFLLCKVNIFPFIINIFGIYFMKIIFFNIMDDSYLNQLLLWWLSLLWPGSWVEKGLLENSELKLTFSAVWVVLQNKMFGRSRPRQTHNCYSELQELPTLPLAWGQSLLSWPRSFG